MIKLQNIKNIYFIGIGGSGVSSIANMMLAKNKNVIGSDKERTLTTNELEEKGAKIFYKQDGTHITKNIDLVVYTVAVTENNPEVLRAKELNIPLLSYPQMLGVISEGMVTIAVSGTHGKTTTTAMLAHILDNTNIFPSVIVGSVLSDQGSNFIEGDGKYLLIEADEYRKSFLNINPKYLIITNIDEDHLDFYQNLSDIQSAFIELVQKIPSDGFLICDKSTPHLWPIVKKANCSVIDYSSFFSKNFGLSVPGIHNRQNAAAAFAMARVLGVGVGVIYKKFNTFKNVRRRFEYKGKTKSGALVYDDYAHNPQKIRAALQGAKEMFPDKEIVAVFQPHLFSRTKLLLKEFGKSFVNADIVFLAPIYAAREEFDPFISSETLAQEIGNNGVPVESYGSLDEIKENLSQVLKDNDVVVILGAGDIVNLSEKIIS